MNKVIAMKCDTNDMKGLSAEAERAIQDNFNPHVVFNIVSTGGDSKAEVEAIGKIIAANANVKLF